MDFGESRPQVWEIEIHGSLRLRDPHASNAASPAAMNMDAARPGRAAPAAAPAAAEGSAEGSAARAPDAWEARIARRVATLPPDEVSADLRVAHRALSLMRAGSAGLNAPGAPLPRLAAAACDYLRGVVLYTDVVGYRPRLDTSLIPVRAAVDAERGRPLELGAAGGGGPLELDFLRSICMHAETWHYDRPSLCPEAQGLARALARALEFWAPRGAELYARLAALGVCEDRSLAALIDVLFVLSLSLADTMSAAGDSRVPGLKAAVGVNRFALSAASELAHEQAKAKPRAGYATAMRALASAEARGHNFMAARLAHVTKKLRVRRRARRRRVAPRAGAPARGQGARAARRRPRRRAGRAVGRARRERPRGRVLGRALLRGRRRRRPAPVPRPQARAPRAPHRDRAPQMRALRRRGHGDGAVLGVPHGGAAGLLLLRRLPEGALAGAQGGVRRRSGDAPRPQPRLNGREALVTSLDSTSGQRS